MNNKEHPCPICGEWHRGDYQVCDKCQLREELEYLDAQIDYDYVTDDFNYDCAREGRRR